jgi:hypothetical protein
MDSAEPALSGAEGLTTGLGRRYAKLRRKIIWLATQSTTTKL